MAKLLTVWVKDTDDDSYDTFYLVSDAILTDDKLKIVTKMEKWFDAEISNEEFRPLVPNIDDIRFIEDDSVESDVSAYTIISETIADMAAKSLGEFVSITKDEITLWG